MFRANSKHDALPFENPQITSRRKSLSSTPRLTRRKRSRSQSRLPPAIYDILYTYPASFRSLILLLTVGSLLFWVSTNILVFGRFLLVDSLFAGGWFGKSHLALRKEPLIFIHSPWSAAIVWETNQNRTELGARRKGVGLRYWKSSTAGQSSVDGKGPITIPLAEKMTKLVVPTVDVKKPTGRGGNNRWVHSVLLDNLEPGTNYGYELFLELDHQDPKFPHTPASLKSYGEYEFTWLGINAPDPENIAHISSTSPSANNTVTPIHMTIIGDTYQNPRVLHSLTKKYLDLKSYIPGPDSPFRPRKITKHTVTPPTKPHALIHLGNAVPDPEDHREWQTGFWDPMTFQQKASSEIPILYARGPRDFDLNGSSIYTGGLPAVQLGEVNRTRVALLKNQANRIILPGFAVAERQYTAIKSTHRDRRTRASFVGYSPHPRVRVLVLDPNLIPERQAFVGSRSSLTELGDHEHWLLWEMARPEWKEASIRMIVVNVAPFPEYIDAQTWAEEHQTNWDTYVRTVFAPHFHGTSSVALQFDIPAATLVVSSQPAAYSRGLLQNFLAWNYVNEASAANIPVRVKKSSKLEHYSTSDPHHPSVEQGVIYVSTPGQRRPGPAHEHAENWGFYEAESDFSKRKKTPTFFSSLTLDLAPEGYDSSADLMTDWDENSERRLEWDAKGIRLYHTLGSQLVCDRPSSEDTKAGQNKKIYGIAYDRLYWRTISSKGTVIDQFVIEAAACRAT